MATMILSTAGSAVGNYLPVPGGSGLGRRAGSALGKIIDAELFGRVPENESAFLDIAVQRSAYGKIIPLCFGTMRLSGNVIWAMPIREDTIYREGGKGTSIIPQPDIPAGESYRYASLAVSICAGKVSKLRRMFADDRSLDLSRITYRFYQGDETQTPDPLISAQEGDQSTPAYRGLSYVVFEDFPLAEYNGRIPNFSFEITVIPDNIEDDTSHARPEDAVTAITIIPGAGEYVYDTRTQYRISVYDNGLHRVQEGGEKEVNRHQDSGFTDAEAAVEDMADTFANIEWVSVVITWFATSLDAAHCRIIPGVEFTDSMAEITPDAWYVNGISRSQAYVVGADEEGKPRYGGTPSDRSLLRFFDLLKTKGYKVMAYPMPFVDTADKPWRGRITGAAEDISDFFVREHGFNAFTLHYAELLKDKADAIVIGSEMIGLTSVQDASGNFPAVDAYVDLAAQVKDIVGASTAVTYAADWSEYHHTEGGIYHLDPIWASPNIDMVGIDAYFPLTNAHEQDITLEDIKNGWTSGEGYDFYYTNIERSETAPLTPAYAWKNIQWWHSHLHTNPDGTVTDWLPQSKPIWFTEYGFPSVDGATNQPNVFYDPKSSESAFPRLSKGDTNTAAQRRAIIATEAVWKDSTIVTHKFLWTWDARPYPIWPDRRDIWADAPLWEKGHWVQGKFGRADLASVLRVILKRAGIDIAKTDLTKVSTYFVDGYVVSQSESAADIVDMLSDIYGITLSVRDGILTAIPHEDRNEMLLSAQSFISEKRSEYASASMIRTDHTDIPSTLEVVYIDRTRGYEANARHAFVEEAAGSARNMTASLRLPFVLSGHEARALAERLLHARRAQRKQLRAMLSPEYMFLTPGDHIIITDISTRYEISQITIQKEGGVDIEAYGLPDMASHQPIAEEEYIRIPSDSHVTTDHILLSGINIPPMPGFIAPERRFGVCIASASEKVIRGGAAIAVSTDNGTSFSDIGTSSFNAAFGTLIEDIERTLPHIPDERQALLVSFRSNSVPESITVQAWRNGTNRIHINGEIILFRDVTYLAPYRYSFSGLIRGAYGTDAHIANHHALTPVIIPTSHIFVASAEFLGSGAPVILKATPFGGSDEDAVVTDFLYDGSDIAPFAPVHLKGVVQQNGDVQLSWIRRARMSGQWASGMDVPLSERQEHYRIVIKTALSSVILREDDVYQTSYIYTKAMQTEDDLLVLEHLMIEVRQLSDRAGEGYAGRMVLQV